jgi:hypothetical protein
MLAPGTVASLAANSLKSCHAKRVQSAWHLFRLIGMTEKARTDNGTGELAFGMETGGQVPDSLARKPA